MVDSAIIFTDDSVALSLFIFPSLISAHIGFASEHSDGGVALHGFLRASPHLQAVHFDRCDNLDFRKIFTSDSPLLLEKLQWTIGSLNHISSLPSDSSIPLFFRENMPTLDEIIVSCRGDPWDDGRNYWPILDFIQQLAFQPSTSHSPTTITLDVIRSQLHDTTQAALANIQELELPHVFIKLG
ncbi:hypothetical protein DL96DRAFT_1822582 [Flagelloscypha sp. PMI_526]|nr:hypothetical protein DL96DRAFT_1822582 [Flagelloscypha sp. PMI_526]